MPNFRTKPIIIEAVQFTPALALAMLRNEADGPFGLRISSGRWSESTKTVNAAATYIEIDTRGGRVLCHVGDWVVRHPNGELSPYKPDVFAARYEAVGAPTSPSRRVANRAGGRR